MTSGDRVVSAPTRSFTCSARCQRRRSNSRQNSERWFTHSVTVHRATPAAPAASQWAPPVNSTSIARCCESDNPDGRVWSGTAIRIGPHPGSNARWERDPQRNQRADARITSYLMTDSWSGLDFSMFSSHDQIWFQLQVLRGTTSAWLACGQRRLPPLRAAQSVTPRAWLPDSIGSDCRLRLASCGFLQ